METRNHLAQEAFSRRDVKLSKQVHANKASMEAGHNMRGSIFPREAFEGAVVSACLVTAFVSVTNDEKIILAAATGCLVVIAMMFSLRDFIYSSSTLQHYERERAREKWELENYPEGEKLEMVNLYSSKGLRKEDAESIVNVMANYEEFFVNVMMLEELELLPLRASPLFQGLSTFFTFLIYASLPIFSYLAHRHSLIQHYLLFSGLDNGLKGILCIFIYIAFFYAKYPITPLGWKLLVFGSIFFCILGLPTMIYYLYSIMHYFGWI